MVGMILIVVTSYWFWQSRAGYVVETGYLAVVKAYQENQSNIMIEVEGEVVRVLRTNPNHERYQEFIIRIENGMSLNVVNDSKYSKRLPLQVGDQITVRGVYTWTEAGGVIRWTHRDSSRQRRHGWIKHEGKLYD